MVNVRHYRPAGTTPDEPALALFQKQWQLYRKVVDYNYLFHREAYNCLRRIIMSESGLLAAGRIRFSDENPNAGPESWKTNAGLAKTRRSGSGRKNAGPA